jgi:hypothetical protein
MSIDRSLDRLAAIKAELSKPSNAEAEGLKAFKVTKTIVLPFGNEEDETVRQDRIIWAEDEESAQAEFVMNAPKPIISWDVREIKPTGGDA